MSDLSAYDLLIFDLDDTLVHTYTDRLLPGIADFFAGGPACPVALATNQGGVAMRYWMELEDFGEPEKFPTEQDVVALLQSVTGQLVALAPALDAIPAYAATGYRNSEGVWAPVPGGMAEKVVARANVRYSYRRDWRKPNPGMLRAAMAHFGVTPARALFVGDMDTDREAAHNAGAAFAWPGDFFTST